MAKKSLNAYATDILRSYNKKVARVEAEPVKMEIAFEESVAEFCSTCDKMAKWETEQDWETGEIKFFCDSCVRGKAKSEKMYKLLISKMTKL